MSATQSCGQRAPAWHQCPTLTAWRPFPGRPMTLPSIQGCPDRPPEYIRQAADVWDRGGRGEARCGQTCGSMRKPWRRRLTACTSTLEHVTANKEPATDRELPAGPNLCTENPQLKISWGVDPSSKISCQDLDASQEYLGHVCWDPPHLGTPPQLAHSTRKAAR